MKREHFNLMFEDETTGDEKIIKVKLEDIPIVTKNWENYTTNVKNKK